MMADGDNPISTEKFYKALLEQNKEREEGFVELKDEMGAMELRLMEEFRVLNGFTRQVDTNTKEIDRLRKRSDALDTIIGLGTLLLTTIRLIVPPWLGGDQ